MAVCCVFSLESPHRGDSNEYTQYTIFNAQQKFSLNYHKTAAQERVRNIRSEQAISVRATKFYCIWFVLEDIYKKKKRHTAAAIK